MTATELELYNGHMTNAQELELLKHEVCLLILRRSRAKTPSGVVRANREIDQRLRAIEALGDYQWASLPVEDLEAIAGRRA